MTMSWESETWSEIRESWPQTHQIHWIGGLKKKISLACFILGSRLWQARMQRERYFVFPFFLLDPALDRFSDLLFIPKQDKKPQREEIKDENSCCSFWFPEPRIDLLSYLRTRSRMLRLLLHSSTVSKLWEGGDSLHLTSPRHLKPFSSVCFYTKDPYFRILIEHLWTLPSSLQRWVPHCRPFSTAVCWWLNSFPH